MPLPPIGRIPNGTAPAGLAGPMPPPNFGIASPGGRPIPPARGVGCGLTPMVGTKSPGRIRPPQPKGLGAVCSWPGISLSVACAPAMGLVPITCAGGGPAGGRGVLTALALAFPTDLTPCSFSSSGAGAAPLPWRLGEAPGAPSTCAKLLAFEGRGRGRPAAATGCCGVAQTPAAAEGTSAEEGPGPPRRLRAWSPRRAARRSSMLPPALDPRGVLLRRSPRAPAAAPCRDDLWARSSPAPRGCAAGRGLALPWPREERSAPGSRAPSRGPRSSRCFPWRSSRGRSPRCSSPAPRWPSLVRSRPRSCSRSLLRSRSRS